MYYSPSLATRGALLTISRYSRCITHHPSLLEVHYSPSFATRGALLTIHCYSRCITYHPSLLEVHYSPSLPRYSRSITHHPSLLEVHYLPSLGTQGALLTVPRYSRCITHHPSVLKVHDSPSIQTWFFACRNSRSWCTLQRVEGLNQEEGKFFARASLLFVFLCECALCMDHCCYIL